MRKLTNEDFKIRASIKHNNKYIYDKTDVNNRDENGKIILTCPIHGEFKQTLSQHLHGYGCKKCANEMIGNKLRSNTENFIEKARKIHGDKYDYSETIYGKNNNDIVYITCKKHGIFPQTPHLHLAGYGCSQCKTDKLRSLFLNSKEQFIQNAKKVHGDLYDYSMVDYKGCDVDVSIICNKHGVFKQTPYKHVNEGHGCQICNASHLELEVMNILKENKIVFEYQKRFNWLGKKSLDFYLPEYNIAIECQGRQHFEAIDFFGGEKSLYENKERDKIKFELCKKNNVALIYYILPQFEHYMSNTTYFIDKENMVQYLQSKSI